MEALIFFSKAREGDSIPRFKVGRKWWCLIFCLQMTEIFCEAFKSQILHLYWVLMWFKAIMGDHEKNELISIERVLTLEEFGYSRV